MKNNIETTCPFTRYIFQIQIDIRAAREAPERNPKCALDINEIAYILFIQYI
jgi:hypothetical protein